MDIYLPIYIFYPMARTQCTMAVYTPDVRRTLVGTTCLQKDYSSADPVHFATEYYLDVRWSCADEGWSLFVRLDVLMSFVNHFLLFFHLFWLLFSRSWAIHLGFVLDFGLICCSIIRCEKRDPCSSDMTSCCCSASSLLASNVYE